MTQVEWRAVRQGSGTVDTSLYDLRPLGDAYKQFASAAVATFRDPDGTKNSDYPQGQRVELQYSTDGGSNWTTRFAGTALETTRNTRDAVPQLDVDIVGYDHLLKRRRVYKTYSSTTISSILNDVITQFTSVTWNASNVNVQNDKTITREFLGTKVDEIIRYLSSESANEEFGVNDSLEFFFRQQDVSRAPELTDADIIDHDLPNNGKETINRFKLFYGPSGSRSAVVVEDREAQQRLKDKLSSPRRVVLSDSDTLPEITNEDRAKAIANQRLGERSQLLTGTVTTFQRFDTEPGDVFKLTRSEAGIEAEDFRVAQVNYYWQRGQTELTIAEQRGNIDDLLVGLSDSVTNDRSRDADPTATATRFLVFTSGVDISTTVTVRQLTRRTDSFTAGLGGSASQSSFAPADDVGFNYDNFATASEESTVLTRAFLNACRDVWQGESAPDISHFGIGTDDAKPTRADNSLQSQVLRTSQMVFKAGSSSTKFKFDGYVDNDPAAIGQTLAEAMFFNAASGNDGYIRTTFADLSHDGENETSVRIECTISNDADQQGVVTDKGQERLRDLLIGETGHEPSDMVYGTGTTAAATGDTSLGSQVHEDTINSTADRKTGITDVVERMGSGEVNGNDLSELGEENSSDELLTRIVFEALSKTSSIVLETNHRFRASNA